ncbi:glyoxalase [Pseudonocardia spinosispora]|uniref:glyoxalase n=1 Tax=Pseudonocardia spinosispora TaxID=103441 RepID=UPI00041AE6BB|nr:glyoxalase [Pseudonocardia spinosispora]
MKRTRIIALAAIGMASLVVSACGTASAPQSTANVAAAQPYGVQYDATHVYVEHGKLNDFIQSWEGTFGGTHNAPSAFQITPTASNTMASIMHSPVGLLAAYDYQTPIPYPFGSEQTGFGVHNPDSAVKVAQQAGATVPVAPWTGPVGREAVIRFPGGYSSQIWEQFDMSGFTPLTTQPEFRVYLSEDTVSAFLASYLKFTGGKVISDVSNADGGEIGAPGTTFHRVRMTTPFGNTVVLATNQGAWTYPYGHDTTGYTVPNLADTIAKAKANGVTVLAGPYKSADRSSVMMQFPGGYTAEVHDGEFH